MLVAAHHRDACMQAGYDCMVALLQHSVLLYGSEWSYASLHECVMGMMLLTAQKATTVVAHTAMHTLVPSKY